MIASTVSRSAPTITSQNPFTSLSSSCASARSPAANPQPATAPSQAGGIELDQLTGTITRQGRTIRLTAKERAVLEALLKSSPAPLSN